MMLLAENGPIPDGLVKHFGEFMEDEHSGLKKPLWRQQAGTLLVVLAVAFIAQCVVNWHAFHDQGFKAFRWDEFLAGAVGAVAILWLVGQRREITTLGIGEATAKKLQ